MRGQSVLDNIEGFLFRPIKVTTTERWLIIGGCFMLGYLIGWQLL